MKDNKKLYIVPQVSFEDFEIATKIAGACGNDQYEQLKAWGYFGGLENGCSPLPAGTVDDPYKVCYHTMDLLYGS